MTDKQREKFESAFKDWHPNKTGPYIKQIAEYFWQAAIASIEIEFSDTFSPNDCGGDAVWLDIAIKNVQKAGVRVKS